MIFNLKGKMRRKNFDSIKFLNQLNFQNARFSGHTKVSVRKTFLCETKYRTITKLILKKWINK